MNFRKLSEQFHSVKPILPRVLVDFFKRPGSYMLPRKCWIATDILYLSVTFLESFEKSHGVEPETPRDFLP